MKWIVVFGEGSDLRAVSYVYNDYNTAMIEVRYLLKQGVEHVYTVPFNWSREKIASTPTPNTSGGSA